MNKFPNVFTDVFDRLRLRGVFVSEWALSTPWGIAGQQESCALIHFMVKGTAFVTTAGGTPVQVGPGDLVMFPRGESHTIGDAPDSEALPLESLLPEREIERFSPIRIGGGGGGSDGQMLCAGLHFEAEGPLSLYELLPSMLIISAEEINSEPLLAHMLDGLTSELTVYGKGRNIVLVRGFELVYVLALRVALRDAGALGKFSVAMQHRGIGSSLLAMHKDYAQQWTVDSLARHAGLSRSAFAKTFKEIVGETPRQHLIGRRLTAAQHLLSTTNLPLSRIAEKIGYESPVGLHLAFSNAFGITPGAFRKQP
jgi:AraC family transcriptional activator of mtrCDE